jgi:hypothetical protein
MTRVVVAIDPAVTSGEEADETGIIGLQPEERIRSRPSSRPAGTLSADLE